MCAFPALHAFPIRQLNASDFPPLERRNHKREQTWVRSSSIHFQHKKATFIYQAANMALLLSGPDHAGPAAHADSAPVCRPKALAHGLPNEEMHPVTHGAVRRKLTNAEGGMQVLATSFPPVFSNEWQILQRHHRERVPGMGF